MRRGAGGDLPAACQRVRLGAEHGRQRRGGGNRRCGLARGHVVCLACARTAPEPSSGEAVVAQGCLAVCGTRSFVGTSSRRRQYWTAPNTTRAQRRDTHCATPVFAGFPLRSVPLELPGYATRQAQGVYGSDFPCTGSALQGACAFGDPYSAAAICAYITQCQVGAWRAACGRGQMCWAGGASCTSADPHVPLQPPTLLCRP